MSSAGSQPPEHKIVNFNCRFLYLSPAQTYSPPPFILICLCLAVRPLCFLQVTDTIKKQSWKSEIIRSDKRCVYTGQRHRILLAFERFRCDTGDIGRECRGHDSANRRSHSKCRRLKKETVFLRNKARSSTIRRGIKDRHHERYITINVSQICFPCCGTVCLKHPRASRDHT